MNKCILWFAFSNKDLMKQTIDVILRAREKHVADLKSKSF